MEHSPPIEPKRRMVMRRNWSLTPTEHRLSQLYTQRHRPLNRWHLQDLQFDLRFETDEQRAKQR